MNVSPKVRDLHDRLSRRMYERRPDRYSPDEPYNDHVHPFVQGPGWMEDVAKEFADELWELTPEEREQLDALSDSDDI